MTKTSEERTARRDALLTYLPVGTTVRTVLRHVSQSGMSRSISLHVVVDNVLVNITVPAANVLGMRIDRYDGIKVTGCGMDM